MSWSFILTDLQGVVHGELQQASQRKVTLPHLRLPTASFVLPLADPLASTLLTTDCLLKCYHKEAARTLAFNGPVVGVEEDGSSAGHTLAVTAVGPFWRLTKRLIPLSKQQAGVSYGTAAAPVVLGAAAQTILTQVNTDNFTGISNSTQAATTTGWAGKWWNKVAAEAIAELSAGLNTFEYRVVPTEPTVVGGAAGGWPRIGFLETAQTIGVSQPDAVFEYGTTRGDMSSYKRTITRDGLLTAAVVSVEGWPNGVTRNAAGTELYHQLVRANGLSFTPPTVPTSPEITARGLFEEVVDDAGVLDDTTRAYMADFQTIVRKNPREVITFSPAPTALPHSSPVPFADYNVGDTVRARAVVSGVVRFDALFRVWGLGFEIDDNGSEVVSLDLVTP